MNSPTTLPQRFGQKIRQLRLEKKLSQEQLAALASLDRTYISGIERGVRNVSLKNIGALALALGVTLPQLFEGLDSV